MSQLLNQNTLQLLIDVLAKVSKTARIDGAVCGEAIVGDEVTIHKGAIVNGPLKVDKNTVIKAGSTINGGGVIGPDVFINERVSLNGKINLKKTTIAKGTTLNGNIDIEGNSALKTIQATMTVTKGHYSLPRNTKVPHKSPHF